MHILVRLSVRKCTEDMGESANAITIATGLATSAWTRGFKEGYRTRPELIAHVEVIVEDWPDDRPDSDDGAILLGFMGHHYHDRGQSQKALSRYGPAYRYVQEAIPNDIGRNFAALKSLLACLYILEFDPQRAMHPEYQRASVRFLYLSQRLWQTGEDRVHDLVAHIEAHWICAAFIYQANLARNKQAEGLINEGMALSMPYASNTRVRLRRARLLSVKVDLLIPRVDMYKNGTWVPDVPEEVDESMIEECNREMIGSIEQLDPADSNNPLMYHSWAHSLLRLARIGQRRGFYKEAEDLSNRGLCAQASEQEREHGRETRAIREGLFCINQARQKQGKAELTLSALEALHTECIPGLYGCRVDTRTDRAHIPLSSHDLSTPAGRSIA
jgi:hypothetical protein